MCGWRVIPLRVLHLFFHSAAWKHSTAIHENIINDFRNLVGNYPDFFVCFWHKNAYIFMFWLLFQAGHKRTSSQREMCAWSKNKIGPKNIDKNVLTLTNSIQLYLYIAFKGVTKQLYWNLDLGLDLRASPMQQWQVVVVVGDTSLWQHETTTLFQVIPDSRIVNL